jgi:uncharacterized protein with HEPN domain
MTVSRDDYWLRLQHMREACDEVQLFTQDKKQADLGTNIMLRRALTMSIGIIGEAASRISDEWREVHPNVPWRDIISMRNYLFHAYHTLDDAILWKTATESVPSLVTQLDSMLAEKNA